MSSAARGHVYYGLRFINTLRQKQNGRHYACDNFKWISINDIVCISNNKASVMAQSPATAQEFWTSLNKHTGKFEMKTFFSV